MENAGKEELRRTSFGSWGTIATWNKPQSASNCGLLRWFAVIFFYQPGQYPTPAAIWLA